MKNVLARKSLLLVTVAALVLLSATASLSQQTPAQVNAEHVALLQSVADWTHEVIDRFQGRGKTVSGDLTRELLAIEGQLSRFERIAKQPTGDQTFSRLDVEDLADRLAKVWLGVRASVLAEDLPAAPAPAPAPASAAAAAPTVAPVSPTTVPRGTNISVELTTWLSSKSAKVGDRFSVLVASPVYSGGQVAIPNGAVLEGLVTAADAAGRASDSGNLHLFIDRLRGPQGQIADMRGLVVGLASGADIQGQGVSAGKTAAGAVVGGLLGGLLEGKKGALVGLAVGAGGTLLAEKGKDVDLPQGSVLRVEVQDAFSFTWAWLSP